MQALSDLIQPISDLANGSYPTQIGLAKIFSDPDGRLVEVRFTPSLIMSLSSAQIARLGRIDSRSKETIESSAAAAVTAWFEDSAIDYSINATTVDHKHWETGKIKQCTVIFNLEKYLDRSES